MQFNNGANNISNNTTNFTNNSKKDISNILTSNKLSSLPDKKPEQALLHHKRNRPEDLDLYKSDSNFIRPIDTYYMPPTQNSNLDGSTPVPGEGFDKNKKTDYYTPQGNKTIDNSELSMNEMSVGEVTNDSNIGGNVANNANVGSDNIPKLQNIVSTVNLKCKLDLRDIALKARNAEYNPKRFAAVIMRIREPKTTALIFASGKMVCTGARSEEDSKKAARQYAKIIARLGYNVRFTEFTIQNIVGSCDVKFPIRLEGLAASDNSKFCSYEPEMFPGLIYRMHCPKIVLLVFVSGKIVLTGAKNREDIYKAYNIILPILRCYKKKEATNSIK